MEDEDGGKKTKRTTRMEGEGRTEGEGVDLSHFIRPIRELADNWNVQIAQDLLAYLEREVTSAAAEGIGGVNFAEAAVLIQGSTMVYSKKVEFLHDLVLRALEKLGRYNPKGWDEKATKAAITKVKANLEEESWDRWLPLDDAIELAPRESLKMPMMTGVAGRTTTGFAGDGDVSTSSSLGMMQSFIDEESGAMMLNGMPVGSTVHVIQKGEMGPEPHFEDVDHSGYDGGDDNGEGYSYSLAQSSPIPSSSSTTTSSAVPVVAKRDDPWAMLDADARDPAKEKPFKRGKCFVVPISSNLQRTNNDRGDGGNNNPNLSFTLAMEEKTGKNEEFWFGPTSSSTLTPPSHLAASALTLKTLKTFKFPRQLAYIKRRKRLELMRAFPGIFSKPKSSTVATNPGASHHLAFVDEDIIDENGAAYGYANEDGGDNNNPRFEDVNIEGDDVDSSTHDSEGFTLPPFGTPSNGGGSGGVGDDAEEETGAGSFRLGTELVKQVEESYADMVRAHVAKFLEGARRWASESKMAVRVRQWHEYVEPMLAEQEARPVFNFATYETALVQSAAEHAAVLEHEPTKEEAIPTVSFEELAAGAAIELPSGNTSRAENEDDDMEEEKLTTAVHAKEATVDKWQVSRLFLATLQLANAGVLTLHAHEHKGKGVESEKHFERRADEGLEVTFDRLSLARQAEKPVTKMGAKARTQQQQYRRAPGKNSENHAVNATNEDPSPSIVTSGKDKVVGVTAPEGKKPRRAVAE